MIQVPASIRSMLDRISLTNEQSFETIASDYYNKEGEIFSAVVVAASFKSNNVNIGTAYGNPANNNPKEQNYHFVRVRKTAALQENKPDPFLEPDKNMAKQLASMHYQGILLNNKANVIPKEGDVWNCRFLGPEKAVVILMDRVGVDKGFLSLTQRDSLFQQSAAEWSNNQPQLMGANYPQPQQPQYRGSNNKGPRNPNVVYYQAKPTAPGTFSSDWWIITLESIIALDAGKKGDKKCKWGKRYDEVCPVDGRGIIGIAHWQRDTLNPLVDETVRLLGEDIIMTWFGKSSSALKAFNKTCTKTSKGNPCYYKHSWWRKGWESFTQHPKTVEIQRAVWKRKYADTSEAQLAGYGWPKTNRNLAIIAGIRNSAGSGGVNKHSSNGKRTPNESLADYVNNSHDPKHRKKRADAVDRVFPS
jgi:hypothetical protein